MIISRSQKTEQTMKINTIRKIDKYFGKTLCFCLTLLRKTINIFLKSKKDKKTKKILFIKLIEQGATVLAHSTIKKAIDKYGLSNVYFFVLTENRPILDILNIVKEQNIIELSNASFSSTFIQTLRCILKIRSFKIDTVIDMESFSRTSAILSYLSGAKKRIGFHRFNSELSYRGDLFTHRVQFNPHLHISISYHLLLETIEQDAQDIPHPKINLKNITYNNPKFDSKDEEKQNLIEKIKSIYPLQYSKIIILNSNASDIIPHRKWPIDHFKTLTHYILSYYSNSIVVFTGLQKEFEKINNVLSPLNNSRTLNMAGMLSLRELIVLYTISDVLVTNDSGPGHFASLTNIHNIVLFGPETPIIFSPLSPNTHIIHTDLACSPCVNPFNHRFSPCTNNICMNRISPEHVFDKIKSILSQASSL